MTQYAVCELPGFDGSAALSLERRSLVLIEGGRGRSQRDGRRERERANARHGLTSAQSLRFMVVCGLAVVALLVASMVSDALVAQSVAHALSDAPRESIVVSEGDSLWEIAQERCGSLDVRDVVSWIIEENSLPGASVDAGSVLVVPELGSLG